MESFKISLYREIVYKDKGGASREGFILFKVFTKETSNYKKFFSETFIKICCLNVVIFMNSLI